MKILLTSHSFAPAIGGIETCSLDLALEFSKQGHKVQVLTQTVSNNPDDDHGLDVIRRPGRSELIRAMRWCDLIFQNNISLQTAWPLLFTRKPWLVCTATWLRNPDGTTGFASHLKRLALRFATNIYISEAIQNHVGHPGFAVPNPYDSKTFRIISEIKRERSLVFLGRLVSDKGCDLLLQSLAILHDAGLELPLTIIGSGTEREALKKKVNALKLSDLVRFAGSLRGETLARELNRHQVMVVPSRWQEPFGIVALEGIACGCVVVGSAGGGLPDAIGPCGVLFKNNDANDLARAIRKVFEDKEVTNQFETSAAEHLRKHHVETIAARYIEIFKKAIG